MDRLTEPDFKFTSDYVAQRIQSLSIAQCLSKLQEYENLEEQGLLVRLPCRVGDIVYTNIKFYGRYWREKDKPYSAEIVFVGLNGDVATGGGFINVAYLTGHMLQFSFCDIGKTVFLTHEAAKKALEEMNAKNDTQANECSLCRKSGKKKVCIDKKTGETCEFYGGESDK